MTQTPPHTPALRFPEFRGAGAWEVKKLGELCEIATGKLDANAMVENGQYRFYTCAKDYYFIDKYAFDTDALLISGNGANVGYIHHYKGKFNAYQRTYVLDKFPESILFIKHYLDYNLHKRISVEKKEGNTPYIVKSTLADMNIMLPPLAEQEKIAECLSSLDELITAHSDKLDGLKDYKRGLMQQLFPAKGETTPTLRFPEFQGKDPWQEKRLGDVLTSISNGLNLEQVKEVTSYKVTRIETISNDVINTEKVGYIKPEQDISSYKLNIGDMLYSNINSLSHIGRVVIIDRDYNLYHGMNLLRLVVDKNLNNPQFIYYLLNTEEIKLSFKSRANPAVNQASINQTELSKTRIIVPPPAEQQKIADCLSAMDELITAQADKIETLKTYKKGLMQQLFPKL